MNTVFNRKNYKKQIDLKLQNHRFLEYKIVHASIFKQPTNYVRVSAGIACLSDCLSKWVRNYACRALGGTMQGNH